MLRKINLFRVLITAFLININFIFSQDKGLEYYQNREYEEAKNYYENIKPKILFEKIGSGKVKIEIFKKYKLEDIVQAHKDLEGRKILGPAVITPN